MALAWRNAASYTLSLPDNAPVWDEAALEPELVLPDFSTMTGFFLVVSWTWRTSSLPRLAPSMYIPMTLV